MPQVAGYQDYARVSAQAAEVFFEQTANISSWPNSPVIDGNGFGYVLLTMASNGSTTDIWSVSVSFYADQAATIFLGAYNYTSQTGPFMTQQMPMLARYFQVTRQWAAGPGTTSVTVYCIGMNQPIQEYESTLDGMPFMSNVGMVAASGSFTLGPNTPGFGTYKLAVSSSGGNKWTVTVNFLDFVGAAFQTMILLIGADYGSSHVADIKLPSVPIEVIVANTDTAAHTIWFSLT